MEYLYLLAAVAASAALSIMSSLFGRKNASVAHTSSLYSVTVTAAAALAWGGMALVSPAFDVRVLFYSILYGVFYTVAMIGMFMAYRVGSVSLTAFVKQLSLIAVAIWGLLFWGDTLSRTVGIGLFFIVCALYLCFVPKKGKESEKTFTLKWLFFAAMLLVGNAGCSVTQKYQQMDFDGRYGNSFMFFAVLFSFFVCLALYLKGKKKCRPSDLRGASLIFPIIGGVSSACLNLLTLLLFASPISPSVIFPTIAVGGLAVTVLFSFFVYRERLRKMQWLGLAVGALALVFLNI